MYTNTRDHYQTSAVETASPAQLVLMLYDGALAAIVRARLSAGAEAVNRELLKAQDIVSELLVTLDHGRGGALAANLASLYGFCLDRLVAANLRKDLSLLDDVEPVLRGLRDAWEIDDR
jgi:flagellar protein FliS